MDAGINVEGTKPETIKMITDGFIEILKSDHDEATIQVALTQFPLALRALPPINISNNLINGGKSKKNKAFPEI